MQNKQVKPINEERVFGLDELFFSTTDPRGVIRYGNHVFTRIADYPLEDMIGQPHSLVRHPDMPRCAFRLVWQYLNQGKTVAAYVKNLARDGRYYWVLALIVPIDDGYLSIRLKPSSKVFGIVKGAYAQVLQAEQQAKVGKASGRAIMDAGAAKLMELLGGLGFEDYDAFMWAALSAEMTSREKARGATASTSDRARQEVSEGDTDRLLDLFGQASELERQLADVFAKPSSFSALRDEIVPKSRFILDLGHDIRLQSINAEVQAARLGEKARALAVVAEHLGQHAGDGSETAKGLDDCLRRLIRPIAELVFNAMVSKVQVEMASSFVREILDAKRQGHAEQQAGQIEQNLVLLFRSFLQTVRAVPEALDRMQAQLNDIDRQVGRLAHFMDKLRFIYLAGRIETARHHDAQSFIAIFDQIKAMIDESEGVLAGLVEQVESNRQQISAIGGVDADAFDRLEKRLAA